MGKKYTYEQVKTIIEKHGMKLVSTEYVSNKKPLDLLCVCGNPYKACLSTVKMGKVCLECGHRKRLDTCKKTGKTGFHHVKSKRAYTTFTKYFTSIGFTIKTTPEQYEKDHSLLGYPYAEITYVCPDGHETTASGTIINTSKQNIKKGIRSDMCGTCTYSKYTEKSFTKYKKLVKEKTGHTLLEYTRSDKPCTYKCLSCEKEVSSYISNILKSTTGKCDSCGPTIQQSMEEKYGVDNCMKIPEFVYKNMSVQSAIKTYTFPTGKTAEVQGYEPQTLDKLLQECHPFIEQPLYEDEIYLGKDVPTIAYTFEDKEHIYYPDIFIRTRERRMWYIEVKSTWTFKRNPEKNYAKWKAVAMSGNIIQIYIFSGNAKEVDVITFYPFMEQPIESTTKSEYYDKLVSIDL